MAYIRVDVSHTVINGTNVSFQAPCNCTAVAGIKAYFPNKAGNITSKVFTFTDAHGNDLTGVGNLFQTGAIVKAILNVDEGKAFLQNADTNKYLEGKLNSKAPSTHSHTAAEVGARPNTWMPTAADVGARPNTWTPTAADVGAVDYATMNAAIGNLAEKTMLSAETAVKYGFSGENVTVDNALDALASSIIAQGVTTLYVRDGDGNAFSNVAIDGVLGVNGNAVTTDSNGVAQVVVTAAVNATFRSEYADVPDFTTTLHPNYSGINEITVTVPYAAAGSVQFFTESGTIKFRKARTVSLAVVGGGTGGYGGDGASASGDGTWDASTGSGGSGGDGGKVYNVSASVAANTNYTLAVGAGGNGGAGGESHGTWASSASAGSAGGATTFGGWSSESGTSTIVPFNDNSVMAGGKGGSGGRGNGTSAGYESGAEGSVGVRAGGKGGQGGGNNSHRYGYTGETGGPGGGGGGGGGGGTSGYYEYAGGGGAGGKGGSGALLIKF